MSSTAQPTQLLGNINRLKLELTSPINAHFDMEYPQLMILVGPNGTGKSLVLKSVWCMSTLLGMWQHQAGKRSTESIAHYIFDNSFVEQNFDGEIEATYAHGRARVVFDQGDVIKAECFMDPGTLATPAIYMSTATRLFSDLDSMLTLEKKLPDIEQMLDFYRLYDLAYLETLKIIIGDGLKLPEKIKEVLRDLPGWQSDIDEILIYNNSFCYRDGSGDIKRLATLGNGEQAVLNMAIAQQFGSTGGVAQ